MHSDLEIRKLSEKEFFAMQNEWSDLLDRSTADRLFMSWEWLSSWWETWGDLLKSRLLLLSVNKGDTLIALAPFYIHTRLLRFGVSLTELHLMGNAWQITTTVRTEYVDLIVDRRYPHTATQAISEYLLKYYKWDLITICDLKSRTTLSNFHILISRLGARCFTRSRDKGVCIDTSGDFDEWLGELGQNTRLKAFNRRKYINKNYREIKLISETDYNNALNILNSFHNERWGKSCFIDDSLEFHNRLLGKLKPENVRFTVLEIDNNKISILYDITIGDKVYNLQAGIDEYFDKKISPGTLHLGFVIESAFKLNQIKYYDLLAGGGKKTFYKSRFKGKIIHFETNHYIRSFWLKAAVFIYEIFPEHLARRLAKIISK